jgi:prefoldin subunit 5
MLDPNFDPMAILQSHEDTLNDLIKAHNELAQFTEQLTEKILQLENRVMSTEQELNRIYNYVGENLQ